MLASWTERCMGMPPLGRLGRPEARRTAPKHYKRRTIVAKCARGGAKHSGKAAR